MGDPAQPTGVTVGGMERRIRIAAVGFVLAWFFVPALRNGIPAWLPFLAFAALETHFLIAGWRERGEPREQHDRAPQPVDLERFGTGYDPFSPPPPRRRWLPRLEGIAVLGVLAALVLLWPEGGWRGLSDAERAQTESRLSSEASRIAGKVVRVRCDAEGDAVGIVQHADGIAEVGGRNALLTPVICFRLRRLAFDGDEDSFSQTARAIAVLAHEAWHLRGVRDEGVANCYAFQSGVRLGQRLGLSRGTASRMMRQQLAENEIQARAAPEYLVPPECRNGGRLDLDPGTSRFP